MNQKLYFYLRRLCYIGSGLSTHAILISLNIWAAYALMKRNSFDIGILILSLVMFLIILAVHLLITLFTTMDLDDEKGYVSFLRYPVRMFMKRKIIYDSRLGYFMGYIDSEHIHIFDQRFFGLKKIVQFTIHADVDILSDSIKSKLNSVYNTKVYELSIKKNIRDAQTKLLKDWDGFLDKETRRDEKIKNILK